MKDKKTVEEIIRELVYSVIKEDEDESIPPQMAFKQNKPAFPPKEAEALRLKANPFDKGDEVYKSAQVEKEEKLSNDEISKHAKILDEVLCKELHKIRNHQYKIVESYLRKNKINLNSIDAAKILTELDYQNTLKYHTEDIINAYKGLESSAE